MEKALKRLEWGHVLFVLGIGGWVSWYFLDAYHASSTVTNLILIAPASALALCLCGLILFRRLRDACTAPDAVEPEAPAEAETPAGASGLTRYRPVAFIVLFGLYIVGLETIGYDVASWLFIAASLVLAGERRPLTVIVYSLLFGSLAVWLFGLMTPYPMPTLVVPIS